VAVWWVAYGSYLPAPTSDNIKVWGQEDGSKPIKRETATIAVLEEEMQKLKEEKEKMEEELKRLKAK
jgi:cell division protein FtsB